MRRNKLQILFTPPPLLQKLGFSKIKQKTFELSDTKAGGFGEHWTLDRSDKSFVEIERLANQANQLSGSIERKK